MNSHSVNYTRDRRLVALSVGALMFGISCCGCGSVFWALAGRGVEEAAVVRPVRTLTIAASGGAVTRSFTGTARPGEEARLSFKVAGLVRAVHVKVGDRVAPGDEIAELDPIDFQLQLQQVDAALGQATAFERNADATYGRVRGLYVEDNASHSDLDAARASAESAEATVSAARQQRALAAQQLGYATLTAGREGAVVDVLVNEGENVAPGQPVATIASGSHPEIVIGVPASLIGRITEGQEAVATFAELDGLPFAVTATEVGVATSQSSAFPVTFRLEEASDQVRSGMSAEVTIDFPSTEERSHIRVPPVAIAEDRSGQHLWVVEPTTDGLAVVRRRPVLLGELTTEGVDVVTGLRVGDVVVTAGVSRIQDGQVVRLMQDVP